MDEWKLEIWYKIRNRLTTGSRLQHSFLFFHFINPIYYRSLIFIFFRRLFEDIFWALTYSTNDFGNESRLKTSHRKYSWKCSNWSRITWYILCCSTFSFCSFFRSCNCYWNWISGLSPSIHSPYLSLRILQKKMKDVWQLMHSIIL